jgi:hypothetical protein
MEATVKPKWTLPAAERQSALGSGATKFSTSPLLKHNLGDLQSDYS